MSHVLFPVLSSSLSFIRSKASFGGTKADEDGDSEYSLPGGYRPIVLIPAHCSWSHIRYTDPDIALVQSDEDRLLGLNPGAEDDPEGKLSGDLSILSTSVL